MKLGPTISLLIVAVVAILFSVNTHGKPSALQRKADALSEDAGGNYVRLGPVVTGSLSEDEKEDHLKVLRSGACYRFTAVGDKGIKVINLAVFKGKKRLEDGIVGEDGTMASVCVQEDFEATVRVRVTNGSGDYALGIYAKGDADMDITRRELDALNEVKSFAVRVAPEMIRHGEPVSGVLSHRSSERFELTLSQGHCYKFVAVGSMGVRDLSMTVFAEGEEVTSDRISGRTPVAGWCAPQDTEVQVKLAMYGGEGAFAFVTMASKDTKGTSPERVGGDEKDFVANRLRQLHAQFGAGRAAVSQVFRGNLGQGKEQLFDVKLAAGHCYTIIGAGNPSVKDLDIVLLDRDGKEIVRDGTRNGIPVADTDPCLPFGGKHTIKVKAKRGSGQFAVQIFSD